jgi:hypothetical protein
MNPIKLDSFVMSYHRAVNIVLDPATKNVFEQLPSKRYRSLDMNITFIAPAPHFETWPRHRHSLAILGPFEPVDPAEVVCSSLNDGRVEFRLRGVWR